MLLFGPSDPKIPIGSSDLAEVDGKPHATSSRAVVQCGPMRSSLSSVCLVLAAAMCAACGWSEDRFWVDGLPAWCVEAAACEGFSVEACIDHVRATDRSGCDYDGTAAKECFRATLNGAGQCIDQDDLGTSVFLGPDPCEQIWPDCGPLFNPPFPSGTSPEEAEVR